MVQNKLQSVECMTLGTVIELSTQIRIALLTNQIHIGCLKNMYTHYNTLKRSFGLLRISILVIYKCIHNEQTSGKIAKANLPEMRKKQ